MSERPVSASIRRLNLIGFATVAGLMVVGVGWATTTHVSAAVIAAGQLVVETDIQSVQHPAGGIIGEIRVRDGDLVAAGQVLMRLDGTNAAAELGIVVGRLHELLALQGLLVAERDDAAAIAFAPELVDRAADPAVAAILAATESELALRRTTREGEIAQLEQQRLRLAADATGLREQSLAKARELELLQAQLVTFRGLVDRQLMERSQLTALERDEARLGGEMAQITAALASNERHAEELAIQIQRVGQDYRSAAALELRETNAAIAELQERRIAAQAQLDRLEILAPQAGVVHELAVHTIGGVVAPGEDLMRIVPLADQLIVETRVSPLDRDQLLIGQPASLQLAAFDREAIGRFDGTISGISPTTSVDDRTGAPYYSVRIVMAANQALPLGELVPGMLVTAYITTEPRTVASFLLAPLLDQIGRTFRER